MLPTSNPAASTALSGMVHGSHGSAATGAATVDVVGSETGAPDVDSPHPETSVIAATALATHNRVLLTVGWTRRTAPRFHGNLTPLLPTARPRSLRSRGAQSTKKV